MFERILCNSHIRLFFRKKISEERPQVERPATITPWAMLQPDKSRDESTTSAGNRP
jgi:hypothetical protein